MSDLDAKRVRWIASDAAARREPPPAGLFDNATVGVIDVCNVLARRLVQLEDQINAEARVPPEAAR